MHSYILYDKKAKMTTTLPKKSKEIKQLKKKT
jgi:hypothetical protein